MKKNILFLLFVLIFISNPVLGMKRKRVLEGIDPRQERVKRRRTSNEAFVGLGSAVSSKVEEMVSKDEADLCWCCCDKRDVWTKFDCGHIMCTECVNKLEKYSCPLCRKKIDARNNNQYNSLEQAEESAEENNEDSTIAVMANGLQKMLEEEKNDKAVEVMVRGFKRMFENK